MNEAVNVILGAQTLIMVLTAAPVNPLIIEAAAPVNMTLAANPVMAAVIPGPVQYVVAAQPAPTLLFNVSLMGDGVPGEQGVPGPMGPKGERGSLLLGMYPTAANLPAINGVDVLERDFAFDLAGNFYMIES